MKRKPRIGDTVYSVHESIAGETSWKRKEPYHYVVTEGVVIGIITGGFTQAMVKNYLDGDYMLVSYPKFTDFGRSYFWTREEAEELAEQVSDFYEKAWGWSLKAPLLRPWRKRQEVNQ